MRLSSRILQVTASAVLLAGLALVPTSAQAADPPWMDTSLSPDERADLLAAVMTLDQKLTLFEGSGAGAVAIPELGIPARREIDGATGVITGGTPTTAFPAGLAIASTWNLARARQFGQQVGLETHLTGFSGWAGPEVDLLRTPYSGRQWGSFGEDPLLGGLIPAAAVDGVDQTNDTNGVYSIVKHYNVYNQETQRTTLDAVLDERTLREIYTRQWEPIVAEEPGVIMCAFPKVNGSPSCENPHLLWDILKGELGFEGWVSSDFNACKSLDAYVYGTDVCGPSFPDPAQLRAAVLDGTIPAERWDDMVHRVLRTYFADGLMDNPPPGSLENPRPDPEALPDDVVADGRERAYRTAVEGSVLLHNRRDALPLDGRDLDSVAVIGESADRYIQGFGSDTVIDPTNVSTVVEGIEDRAGTGVDVTHVAGGDPVRAGDNMPGDQPVPSSVLQPAEGTGDGLAAEWFTTPDLSGTPVASRVEDQVNWGQGLVGTLAGFGYDPTPAPKLPDAILAAEEPSARWTGTLEPTVSGRYSLGLTLLGSATLWVNDEEVLTASADRIRQESVDLNLQAGESYDVRIEYVADAPDQCCIVTSNFGPGVRFTWRPPVANASPQIDEAVEAASEADVAVVVATNYMGESLDRGDLVLPQDQDRLIRAVAQANPNTVVVLATGGAVPLPWLSRVDAVMEAWYPGQEQGRAIAALLFGEENFSGKLPLSWPRSDRQVERGLNLESPFPDVNNPNITVDYDDGVFVGYRGYEENGVRPLYPFGHGLSYSSFRYRNVRVDNPRARDDARPNAYRPGRVQVRVTNTSRRTSTETVQLYNGRLNTDRAETPPKQLLGWAQVTLGPRETRWVTIPIELYTPEHKLAYWDTEWGYWITPTGRTRLYVGSSSQDIRFTRTLTVRRP
ncbi:MULTISPECIES: glycoside hydrolase family 3 protein [Mumia]|uniref:glycoside hydrolase family 3 protein n=1 Tax=Mumia TaxID=1546255 RepID=UPI00141FD329|nr:MULTISPECIES: glycoside hydrolase family 3 C-terminal domain-containing protein [unclassified Mumia]QMW65395.1 glycoside hydrolase family 3 C-terminal domain-containing protein [Mumia sp. ZJ1417]